jgi:hypothetical protein
VENRNSNDQFPAVTDAASDRPLDIEARKQSGRKEERPKSDLRFAELYSKHRTDMKKPGGYRNKFRNCLLIVIQREPIVRWLTEGDRLL